MWTPEFKKNGDCECFSGYRCCGLECPKLNKDICFGESNKQKGYYFGVPEKDCCGCPTMKCIACEPPKSQDDCPRGVGAKEKKCYTYKKYHAKDDRQCFESTCVLKPSDAKDEKCNMTCQTVEDGTSKCGFPQKVCKAKKTKCEGKTKAQANQERSKSPGCYSDQVQVDPLDSYWDASKESCMKCVNHTYPKLPCTSKNKVAKQEDCHKHTEDLMDKKCFDKILKKDDCGCVSASCSLKDAVEESDEIGSDEVCPKNHVKIKGITICKKKRRDICKKCPILEKIDANNCPVGRIIKKNDINGCPTIMCQAPEIEPDCDCSEYEYVKEENRMKCDCKGPKLEFAVKPQRIVRFIGGTAGSSGDWKGWPARNAFTQNARGWTSGRNQAPPSYIWYKFPGPLLPAKISFLPRKTSVQNANIVRVKRFQFIGTNDPSCSKNSNWKVLCEGENPPYQSINDERGCTIKNKVQKFRCLGLRSLVRSDSSSGPGEVSLRRIRIWLSDE
jgi:hypothetical protein